MPQQNPKNDGLEVNLYGTGGDANALNATGDPEYSITGVGVPGDEGDDSASSVATVYDEPDKEDTSVLHTDPVASVQTTAINIISNVVGAGILSVPGAFAGMTVIPAIVMLSLFAAMSAYSMLLLTLCAQRTGRFTYKDLIEYAFNSSRYGRLFDGAIFIYTFACCIAYAHSVGDAMSPVMKTLIGHDTVATSKGFWILMASLIFFPLSSLKQLAELKISSLFGFLVIIYMVGVIVVYFFTEPSPTGGMVNSNTEWFAITTQFLVNVPICSVGFSCHYNIPVFYGEMKHRTPSRMVRAIMMAVPSIFVLYIITAMFSVLHFNGQELQKKGDISLNFPSSYTPMTIGRIALFIHFVCVFPIICIAARRAMNSILFNRGNMSRPVYIAEAFGLVAAACLLAWQAKSVLQVFNIAGALFGIAIVVIIPNLLYLKIIPTAEEASLDEVHAGAIDAAEDTRLRSDSSNHPGATGTVQARTPSTRRSSQRGRASSMRRRASSVHHIAWMDNMVAFRGPVMGRLSKFLMVLGALLSIGSFALQIYTTIHPGNSGDDDGTPKPTLAPNATEALAHFAASFGGVASAVAP